MAILDKDTEFSKVLPIVDLFLCVQGEGKLMGVPHLLIRFTGCNLRCEFKGSRCDTPYSSWSPERGKYSLGSVNAMLREHPEIRHVMITGGEPTLHGKDLERVVKLCKMYDRYVTMETNGTILPEKVFRHGDGVDLVSLSPKLMNSVPSDSRLGEAHARLRMNIPALSGWVMSSRDHQLKYVVSEEGDLAEVERQVEMIEDFIRENYTEECPPLNVYLMPEGDNEELLKEKRKWLVKACIERGWNYTDRLHIIIFGDKREA